MKKQLLTCMAIFLFCLFLQLNSKEGSVGDIDDICELDGYTMLTCTNVDGEFEGNSGDIVKLLNGTMFELQDYNYNYAYNPEVGVFAKKIDMQGKSYILYKLFVENSVYDASRIR